jgi:hypothetical protein
MLIGALYGAISGRDRLFIGIEGSFENVSARLMHSLSLEDAIKFTDHRGLCKHIRIREAAMSHHPAGDAQPVPQG